MCVLVLVAIFLSRCRSPDALQVVRAAVASYGPAIALAPDLLQDPALVLQAVPGFGRALLAPFLHREA